MSSARLRDVYGLSVTVHVLAALVGFGVTRHRRAAGACAARGSAAYSAIVRGVDVVGSLIVAALSIVVLMVLKPGKGLVATGGG